MFCIYPGKRVLHVLAAPRVPTLIASKEACRRRARAQRRGLGKGKQPVRGESCDEVCSQRGINTEHKSLLIRGLSVADGRFARKPAAACLEEKAVIHT